MSDEEIPGGIGSRREARERAVELAYEAQVRGMTAAEIVDAQLTSLDRFVVESLKQSEKHRAASDELIRGLAKGWSLERMPTMDKVIMRLAIAELVSSDTPVGVVLNEAVALAGRYSTAESSRFVNGVLSAAAEKLRPAG